MEETIGYKTIERKSLESADIPINLFQLVSRKAWLDLLLQLLKISVFFSDKQNEINEEDLLTLLNLFSPLIDWDYLSKSMKIRYQAQTCF